MPTTYISSSAVSQIVNSSNSLYILQTGSIVRTSTAVTFDAFGGRATIDGLIASDAATIEFETGSFDNTLTIGSTGRVVSMAGSSAAIVMGGDSNKVVNHGEISGSHVVEMSGDHSSFSNFGLVSSSFGLDAIIMSGAFSELNNRGVISELQGGSAISLQNEAQIITNSGEIHSIGTGIKSAGAIDADFA